MQQLHDLVEVDQRFQNSVHLQLDLNNQEKIKQYIPTQSSNHILQHYLDNIQQGKEHATILIGPYGKGKSHLLLVLLDTLRKQKNPYLPVIVSGTYRDMKQAFTIALTDALRREHIEDLIPDNAFLRVEQTIQTWKKEYPHAYNRFLEMLKSYAYQEDAFLKDIRKYNQQTFGIFQSIYSEITFGSEFDPLINSEVNTLYTQVNKKLQQQYGYAGIYIVFDEFSKYIEGHEEETFDRDMHIIQDMCECANASKEPQIHITFVAHKSIKEYGNALSKKKRDTFTGIEGRIKEVRFVVSSKNNYELIEHAIHKKKNIQTYVSETARNSYELDVYRSLFSQEDFTQIIAEGCFPLLPLTATMLLLISEKVAQNERSVFTYLANDEKSSLYRHICSCKNEKQMSVTADTVYDYFENLFREDLTQVSVHTEWLKADYALAQSTDVLEQKVIKVIALLRMIHNAQEFPVRKEMIAYALNLSLEESEELLQQLVSKNIIIKRPQTMAYVFKNHIGLDLGKEIEKQIRKNSHTVDSAQLLGQISQLDYVLPKAHNQKYKITRYFQYRYMSAQQFLALPSVDTLFEEKFADGKIITLIGTEQVAQDELNHKCKQITDERVLVFIPTGIFGAQMQLEKLQAVDDLLKDTQFIADNAVLEQELRITKEDYIYEINQEIEKQFEIQYHRCQVWYMGRNVTAQIDNINTYISKICDNFYGQAPIINNELINRQNISTQNKKARAKIIEKILNRQDCSEYDKGTSPEATIYRATMLYTGLDHEQQQMDQGSRKIIDIIEAFLSTCDSKKQSFDTLYDMLMGRNIGARKGVIPIYIAYVVAYMQDLPILYLKDKEIPINAVIFDNIEKNPEQYYLYVEHDTSAKEQYLKQLSQMFQVSRGSHSKSGLLDDILHGMQDWYRSLPQVSLHAHFSKEYIHEVDYKKIEKIRKLFRQVELNPREVIFDKLYKITAVEDYTEVAAQIAFLKAKMDSYFAALRNQVTRQIRNNFSIQQEENLHAGLKTWYESQSNTAKSYLSSNTASNLMNYLEQDTGNDEWRITENIARIITNVYLEDWTDATIQGFAEQLQKVIQEITAVCEENNTDKSRILVSHGDSIIEKYFDTNDEDDSTSYFLKNAIQDALDEFGDSLEMNQKVAVLVETLEQLIQK